MTTTDKIVTTSFKQKTPRNKKYLDWIKTIPCCICLKPPLSDPHHVNEDGKGGKGIKCSDYRAIPLCHKCHVDIHQLGKRSFAVEHAANYEDLIQFFNELWEEKCAGTLTSKKK